MKCKFCGEELPERGNFCPMCGKDNALEETAEEEMILEESTAEEEAVVEIVPAETELEEEPVEEMLAPEVKKIKRTAAISGCIAALAVLALVLFFGIRSTTGEGLDISGWFDWAVPKENNIFAKESYTLSDSQAQSKANKVVATVGDAELTNGQLQIYYQMAVLEFMEQYGYYLSYIGMDYTKPLDQQPCMLMEGYTWEQFFLESALNSWYKSQVLAILAEENDYQLESNYQSKLDSLDQDMTSSAVMNGYSDADAFLKAQCGANTSMDDYRHYMEVYFNGYLYFAQMCEAIEVPTDEALETYFAENKQTLEAQGIKQDGSYAVDVRHILIKVEGGTENADGTITFSDPAAAAAAKAEAEKILALWLQNPTEDYFGELAREHTADGNGAQGGIYTDVTQGRMVKTFDAWCFDPDRQVGDYGIVETKFGYHIMFFSKRGEDLWLTKTRQAYLGQMETELLENALESYEMEVKYSKIALAYVKMG